MTQATPNVLTKENVVKYAKAFLLLLLIAAVMIPFKTYAGTDTTFDNISLMVSGWLTGSLGKVLALIGLAIALASGLAKGSAAGVIFGITVALIAVYGPDVITTMFSATF